MTNNKEPWKNKNTLDGLYHGDDLNQSEIAEHFSEQGHDVTASTISYWMKKLEINTTHTTHENQRAEESERKCVNYEECGNITPGPRNGICNDCLDKRRGFTNTVTV